MWFSRHCGLFGEDVLDWVHMLKDLSPVYISCPSGLSLNQNRIYIQVSIQAKKNIAKIWLGDFGDFFLSALYICIGFDGHPVCRHSGGNPGQAVSPAHVQAGTRHSQSPAHEALYQAGCEDLS